MDRNGLANFLHRRREALQPGDMGLVPGPRRRTKGLRREEVAQLSGMSTDYYARLEQQRGPQPSEQMVAAIARGLRLGLDERDHLFRLAGHHAPTRVRRAEHVSRALMRVLDRLDDTPAISDRMTTRGGVPMGLVKRLGWVRAVSRSVVVGASCPSGELVVRRPLRRCEGCRDRHRLVRVAGAGQAPGGGRVGLLRPRSADRHSGVRLGLASGAYWRSCSPSRMRAAPRVGWSAAGGCPPVGPTNAEAPWRRCLLRGQDACHDRTHRVSPSSGGRVIRQENLAHHGFVVHDLEAALHAVSAQLGVTMVALPEGSLVVEDGTSTTTVTLRAHQSRQGPVRVELLEAVPGTVWQPVPGGGVHHLAYWSDDVNADARDLEAAGAPTAVVFASAPSAPPTRYHRTQAGVYVELMDVALRPFVEQLVGAGPSARGQVR